MKEILITMILVVTVVVPQILEAIILVNGRIIKWWEKVFGY